MDSRGAGKFHLVEPRQCEGAISFKKSLELPLTVAAGTAKHLQSGAHAQLTVDAACPVQHSTASVLSAGRQQAAAVRHMHVA